MIKGTVRSEADSLTWGVYGTAFVTIVTKEFNRFMRIWLQTILPPAITMGLYFVIFGNLIGPRIGEMGGFTYMQYIAPGIIMMAIITNSYSNVVTSFFGAKFQRHIEEILIAPVPNVLIVTGWVCGGMCRGIIVGALVTVVALFFTELHVRSWLVTIAVVVLTSALFSLGGFINAIFARKFDDISIVPTFILTPLTYLGGVFYSIDLLPDIWRQISLFNPILYMVNAFRFGILGVSDIDLVPAFAIIIAFIIALGTISVLLLQRGVGIRT
jgi:ABC-2 type transport system permease protein